MSTGIDDRFICVSDLELFMVDNQTGYPLAGGIVTFYSQTNPTVLKPVYQLTVSGNTFTYNPLPNPCVLSNAGTFQDGLGNNIVPYYYPFTGTSSQNTGIQELYYIVVQNSGFAPQFTRSGWPQAAGSGVGPVTSGELVNFIPNGQFLAHNSGISALAIDAEPYVQYSYNDGSGAQTLNAQPIAQGGWNFVYDNATTSVFANTFSSIPLTSGWGLTSYPRFAFNFVCTSNVTPPATRDLQIQWRDVYKFSSGGAPTYNLFFNAKSNDGNPYIFQLIQIFYFGTGGSPSNAIENLIATINVGPGTGYEQFNINITFPFPAGTLGTNNDDFVALSIRGPTSSWNVQFTDFVLYEGTAALTSFPTDTNAEMLSQGVAGWMPTPDANGNDLYLPLLLTPQGMIFDHSEVGTIVAAMRSAVNNELPCDGNGYVASTYSSLGIPYSRLQTVLYNSTTGCNVFGNGYNFANAYIDSGTTADVVIYSNKFGISPTNGATSDGTPATNFNFTTLFSGAVQTLFYEAYSNSTGLVTAISTFVAPASIDSSAGTSTMTVIDLFPWNGAGPYYAFTVQAIAASPTFVTGTTGLYFIFSNTNTNYYMWFNTGTETQPAASGPISGYTPVECKLEPGMLAVDVGLAIANCLSQFQGSLIECGAGSTVAAGSNFKFIANGVTYTPWYQVSGSPATTPAGLVNPIKVVIASTSTAAQVATATQQAINNNFVGTPNLAGMFLRGSDPTGIWDLDHAGRWGQQGKIVGGNIGSFEYYQTLQHPQIVNAFASDASGPYQLYTTFSGGGITGVGITATKSTTLQNSPVYLTNSPNISITETRPVNASVNYFIKY